MSEGKGKRLVVGVTLAIAAVAAILALSFRGAESGNAYGFYEPVFEYGKLRHEIYHSDGLDEALLRSLGDNLVEAGYFGDQYGGIARVIEGAGGYRVDLAYPIRHWEDELFLEEMVVMSEDLQRFVFKKPVRLHLVDADEEGVYEKAIAGTD